MYRERRHYRSLDDSMTAFTAWLIMLFGLVVMTLPLIVHVVSTVKSNWAAMLIIGLVIPPVGWVHGVGLMLGWW